MISPKMLALGLVGLAILSSRAKANEKPSLPSQFPTPTPSPDVEIGTIQPVTDSFGGLDDRVLDDEGV